MLLKSLLTAPRVGLVATCCLIAFAVGSTAGVKRPIKKPTLDPQAESVELFDGMDAGQLAVTMIHKDEFEANVFIENTTKKPLTVKLPRSAAGVQILKQGFGPAAGGAGMAGGNGANGMNQQQGNGQAQNTGGGMGGMMGGMQGMGGMGMGGMGMFSIPPERTVQVQFNSVCLNHGKPTPRAALKYKLVRTESVTDDPVLQELLVQVGTGKLDRAAAQAATWHIANKMSWDELAAKSVEQFGGLPNAPYFSRQQLLNAMSLVQAAKVQAENRVKESEPAKAPARTEKKL